jgi:hypothetical protein
VRRADNSFRDSPELEDVVVVAEDPAGIHFIPVAEKPR